MLSLREYQKVHGITNTILHSVSDIVHIYKEKQPRQKYLLGWITNFVESRDSIVRGAVLFVR